MKACKFKIGDKVSHRPDLYGETKSVVIEIIRTFRDPESGIDYLEDEINSMRKDINPRIENINNIDCILHDGLPSTPGKPWSGFGPVCAPVHHYSIITTNKKMNTIWNERQLKLTK